MRRLYLFTYDDVDCASVFLQRAIKSKRGVAAARQFFRLVSAAYDNDQSAVKAALAHRLWFAHCERLAEMRQSGELDAIYRARAFSTRLFREFELQKYKEWREEQRFILQSMEQPVPAWLTA